MRTSSVRVLNELGSFHIQLGVASAQRFVVALTQQEEDCQTFYSSVQQAVAVSAQANPDKPNLDVC